MIGRVLIAVAVFLLAACGRDEQSPPPGEGFVLLAYLAGDNDLTGEAAQKLDAIRRGFDAGVGAQVFVYIDSQDGPPRLLEVKAGAQGNIAQTVTEYPERNSASGETLVSVIEEVWDRSAGERFGMIFFSHATGWLPAGAAANPARSAVPEAGPRSIGRDGTDEMELAEFAAAIPDGMFEFIVLEACFTAGIEVIYALRDKTKYLMGSSAEIVSPGFTNIYPSTLTMLLRGAEGLIPFARAAFEHYDDKSGWERSATFSVIETAGIEELAEFIFTRADLEHVLDTGAVQAFDRYGGKLFFDAADCYSKVFSGHEEETAEIKRLIERCVVWKAATPWFLQGYGGFENTTHSGLTTYWPQPEYPILNAAWLEIFDKTG